LHTGLSIGFSISPGDSVESGTTSFKSTEIKTPGMGKCSVTFTESIEPATKKKEYDFSAAYSAGVGFAVKEYEGIKTTQQDYSSNSEDKPFAKEDNSTNSTMKESKFEPSRLP
jgi:malic enzyme